MEKSNEIKTYKYVQGKGKKEKKEGIDMQSLIEVDEEDSYTLKITARENEQ